MIGHHSMTRRVVTISGFSGSGKSEVSKFLESKKGFVLVSVSSTLKEVFGTLIPRFADISEEERQTEILKVLKRDSNLPSQAIFNKVAGLVNAETIALDGARSKKDFAYLVPEFQVTTIFVYTDFVTRLERVQKRDQPQTPELLMKRDQLDREVGLLELFKDADHVLFNLRETGLKGLFSQTESIVGNLGL